MLEQSDNSPQTTICPNCQSEIQFEVVNVITEGTDEVDKLYEGTLNQVACKGCENSFLFETPLLYRDDTSRSIIYYLPLAMTPGIAQAVETMRQLFDQSFGHLPPEEIPVCRLAVQRGQFIEKIAIHQFQYDDRVIEYIKYLLYQHNPGLDPIRHELLFDFGNSGDESIMFIAYDRETCKPEFALGFKTDDYTALQQSLFTDEAMGGEPDLLFQDFYVTVDDLLRDKD